MKTLNLPHHLGDSASLEIAAPLGLVVAALAAGNGVFLIGLLASPWLGICAFGLIALSLWLLLSATGRTRLTSPPTKDRLKLWALAVGLALLICLLGGEGRLFYANTDWQIRDAVLADLSQHPWPVKYSLSNGVGLVLRAPLGMYMLPSLAGRLLSWRAAAPVLLGQNTLLLAAVLMIFMSAVRRWPERLLVAAVVISFSGLDIIGQVLIGKFANPPDALGMVPSLETWASGLQYSSVITDLFWAPNHGLPALAMAAVYIAWRRNQASSLMLAAVTGLSMLWSPLAVMGAAPFAVLAGLRDLATGRLTLRSPLALVPLGLGLLPVAIYLTLGGGDVEHGLNFKSHEFKFYPIFALLEIFPLLYVASRGVGRSRVDLQEFCLCAIMLLLIPMYRIGMSNDFMMRSSIFPIALSASMAARGLLCDWASQRRRRVCVSVAILVLGGVTPAFEVVRALREPVDPPQATGLIAAWEAPASRGSSKATYTIPVTTLHRKTWLFKE